MIESRPMTPYETMPTSEIRASEASSDRFGQSRFSSEPSLTGEPRVDLMAERLRPIDRGRYNFRMGPVLLRSSAALSFEYNDNLNISDDSAESDLIIYPELRLSLFWPISRRNALSIDLGLGYRKYLDHPELDQASTSLVVNPTTSLSFDIKTGDFYINLHDYPAVQNDPVDELTLSETLVFSRFTNVVGATVRWDLNILQITGGYDHYNVISLTEDADPLDRSEERFMAEAAFRISSGIIAGVQASTVFTDYSEGFLNDSSTSRVGLFSEVRLSPYISLSASGGYQFGKFDSGGLVNDSSDLSSYYADFSLRHNLNRYLSYSASVGHESTLGTNTNFVDVTYLRLSGVWDIINRVSLSTSGAVEYGDESAGAFGRSFVRYSLGLNLGYALTRHSQVSAFYRLVFREGDSGQSNDELGFGANDFKQNVIGLQLVYSF